MNRIGVGYQLRIVRKQESETLAKGKKDFSANIINQVLNNIPGSRLERRSPMEITFFLPQTHTERFPALFQNFENRMEELNIAEIRVNQTSVDDIFVK